MSILNIAVMFAMKQELRSLSRRGALPGVRLILTGMGPQNAEQALRQSFSQREPKLVLTCGFAGSLVPELAVGTVIYSADDETGLASALLAAGARPSTFHCSDRVAVTVAEKALLRRQTGADAVEMESGVIRSLCRERGIPSATVRVVSDAADEDLIFDFNRLTDASQNISAGKMTAALLRRPAKILSMFRFQRRLTATADRLADVLTQVIGVFSA